MIDLYTWRTPNGHKANIMVEETGIAYQLHPVNLGNGEQRAPDYLKINPNGRIPAIVDREGPGGNPLRIFESGAILIYLAQKAGKLLPTDPRQHAETLSWLMFQMAGVGPMFGQVGYFKRQAEPVPAAIKRFVDESNRLLSVLDKRLGETDYLAGEYSIADIATFPWVAVSEPLGLDVAACPNVRRWLDAISARLAVKRGLALV